MKEEGGWKEQDHGEVASKWEGARKVWRKCGRKRPEGGKELTLA